MSGLLAISYAVQDFIDQGGPVLWVIFAACLMLWLLILERAWYIRVTWPTRAKQLVRDWNERRDCASWRAKKIREVMISESAVKPHCRFPSTICWAIVVLPLPEGPPNSTTN